MRNVTKLTAFMLVFITVNSKSQSVVKANISNAEYAINVKPRYGQIFEDTVFKTKAIFNAMQRVADWQINTWNSKGFKASKVDWTNGACYTGLFAFGSLKGNQKYLKVLLDIGNDVKWNTGHLRFYADDYCVGQTYAQLYGRYRRKEMITPFTIQADSIVASPHDEPLHWRNNIQLREWAWCDALFMAPPSLAYLSTTTGDQKYLNTAIKLWWKTTDFLYDPAEKLYFRDETFFNKKEKNGEKVFWSRGNGWVVAGLVRVLENTPKNHPDRARLEKLFKNMISRIARLQQQDGSWHASLLDPDSYPIKEMSGTGFFCYAMAWGLNQGLLDEKTYLPVVKRSWLALNSAVKDGMLGYVQPIGASPDQVNANSTAVYGVGAFLLSGVQLYNFMERHPNY
ncbi:glycoside hydrolase family 88 protein [Mucilaginibacter sp. PAMB04168]|uniref:glycoside hydrolase family 88/105 protein n=1 Tax=Mucilaginibacter sp. PAMB04168 TaxID=3138567 RepID=UPI0031F68BB7